MAPSQGPATSNRRRYPGVDLTRPGPRPIILMPPNVDPRGAQATHDPRSPGLCMVSSNGPAGVSRSCLVRYAPCDWKMAVVENG